MYSFDIYDTLITRKVDKPREIFRLMYDAIEKDGKYNNLRKKIRFDFPEVRQCAEKKAKKKKGGEATFYDIYNELAIYYGLEHYESALLQKLEIKFEIENTIVIQENICRIENIRNSGEKVILISDMYMPVSFFRELFARLAPSLLELPIYISAEAGVTKADGLLFPYVAEKECVSFDEWIHVGDNRVSDYNVPMLYGIKADIYVEKQNNNNKIQTLSTEEIWNRWSKSIQFEKLKCDDKLNCSSSYCLGRDYIGPIILGYVSWIIDTASRYGIERLYFIARDGYILKKISDLIIEKKQADIETYYLYGSRKAWNPQNSNDKALLKRYLEQELNGNFDSLALVDAKGTGKSIDHLASILGTTINVFYYDILEPIEEKKIRPYVYESEGGLIENFCRAPHGATMGYESINGKIVPILEKNKFSNDYVDKITDYIEGAYDFARDILEIDSKDLPLFWLADSIMKKCFLTPSRELAKHIGDIPHDEENKENLYAPYLDQNEVYRIEVERTIEPLESYYHGHNLQYSYKRLSEKELRWLNKCRRDFFEGVVPEKKYNAIRIVIYAFGVYGHELYHRTFYNPNVEVVLIVDKNYQKYQGGTPSVRGLECLLSTAYDYIVVALMDAVQTKTVKEMLVGAGIDKDVILSLKEFDFRFL